MTDRPYAYLTPGASLPRVARAHPHNTDALRAEAEAGLVLRTLVGSTVLGTSLPDADDRDEMGVALELPARVTGTAPAFEQFEAHTAWDREGGEGLAERSGPGDLDVVIYGARKWARLALAGNPTVLTPLFVPDTDVVYHSPLADYLRDHAAWFLSRRAGKRFLGYLHGQRARLVTGRHRTNRPELISVHGYDTKYAGHALRLGYQGVEVLTEGTMTLPLPSAQRERVLQVRRGEVPLETALAEIDGVVTRLEDLLDGQAGPLAVPDEPATREVEAWLHVAHTAYWGTL